MRMSFLYWIVLENFKDYGCSMHNSLNNSIIATACPFGFSFHHFFMLIPPFLSYFSSWLQLFQAKLPQDVMTL